MNSSVPHTFLVGLLGKGIGGSKARQMHEREAASQGLQLVYRILDFDTLGYADDDLGKTLDMMERMGFAGSNVTHPYKQAVIPFLTSLTPEAQALGAVNTIRFVDGKREGHNTDWSGFAASLLEELPNPISGKIAQIGAGGAGSATAFALLKLGADEVVIFDPELAKTQALAERLAPHFPNQTIVAASSPELAIKAAQGIVQTSPIGMAGHEGLPFDLRLLESDQWLTDIIYFPRNTQLVEHAKSQGLAAFGGLSMAIHQAATAFDIITGHHADAKRMRADFEILFAS